jgi:molecular chaperone IbpA
MTNQLTLRSIDIPTINRFGVGLEGIFDNLLRATHQTSNYPPYNIIKHSDDTYSIELAVAGFKDGEVDVEVENNQLTVRGEQQADSESDSKGEYIYKGISARSFVRTFTLADHVEVAGAVVQDGILTVQLERRIPEEKKPKKIAITYGK